MFVSVKRAIVTVLGWAIFAAATSGAGAGVDTSVETNSAMAQDVVDSGGHGWIGSPQP